MERGTCWLSHLLNRKQDKCGAVTAEGEATLRAVFSASVKQTLRNAASLRRKLIKTFLAHWRNTARNACGSPLDGAQQAGQCTPKQM